MNALLFYRSVGMLARALPRRAAYAAAQMAAAWAFRRRVETRRTVCANLQTLLAADGVEKSEPDLERMAHLTFEHFAKYVVDFFRWGELSARELSALVTTENAEFIGQCLATGRGVIGLTAHIGNWELAACVLQAHGARVNTVALRQSTRRLDMLFQSMRTRRGLHVLPHEGTSAAALACLKRNEMLALLADLDFSEHPAWSTFFGRPARLPRGPAVLAVRSGAPILPGFVYRQPDDTFRLRLHAPIIADRSYSVKDVHRRIRAVMEDAIREQPEQWLVFESPWENRATA